MRSTPVSFKATSSTPYIVTRAATYSPSPLPLTLTPPFDHRPLNLSTGNPHPSIPAPHPTPPPPRPPPLTHTLTSCAFELLQHLMLFVFPGQVHVVVAEVAESQPMSTRPSSGTRVVSTQTRQMLSRHEVTSMLATAPLEEGEVRSGYRSFFRDRVLGGLNCDE